jgi:hypothetical protein
LIEETRRTLARQPNSTSVFLFGASDNRNT